MASRPVLGESMSGTEPPALSATSSTSQVSTSSHRITPNHSESFFRSSKNLLHHIDRALVGSPVADDDDYQYIPPWSEPYIIGVAGSSGSGKTSVASKIIQEINQPWTILLSMDNFYRPLSPEARELAFNNEYDFDSPDALDGELLYQCVRSLREGKKTEIPVYSFELHNRIPGKFITIYGANVIIIEGIYALAYEKLADMMDTKIYVDTDLDICLARRLNRDIIERGRDLDGIIKQWNKFVKPNTVKYVHPTIEKADLVIPRGSDNHIGINMIIRHIKTQLQLKSREHLKHLVKLGHVFKPLDESRILRLAMTNQLRAINTILLNKKTQRDEFIFYFDRLATLLLTKGMDLIDYVTFDIETPQHHRMKGLKQSDDIVAVNIIRSGDCFMNSILRTLPDAAIGKLLIQSDSFTGEPQLHTESLPPSIFTSNVKIFIFDAQIISGAAAIMAIQVLKDHDIELENVVLISYLVTEVGARRILNAFPKVKLVVGLMSEIKRLTDTENISDKGSDNAHYDQDWWFRTRFIDSVYFGTN